DAANRRAKQEEMRLVHRAEEAADVALQEIPGEAGDEPESHHHGENGGRSDTRNEGKADGRKIEFAKGNDGKKEQQPNPACMCSSAGKIGARRNDESRRATHTI